MLRERSKIMKFYIKNTIKSIFGFTEIDDNHLNDNYLNGSLLNNNHINANHLKENYLYDNKNNADEKKRIDPVKIPKYKNQLSKPCIYYPISVKKVHKFRRGEKLLLEHLYFIDISEFKQQVLPKGFPQTTVWGCGGLAIEPKKGNIRYVKSYPGGTFEAVRNVPVHIKLKNKLNIPVNIKFYGIENPVISGERYHINLNKQNASAYWYYGWHDEGFDNLKRFGLAGFYLLRENKENKSNMGLIDLPGDKYEYPILIKDFSFYDDGSIAFPEKDSDLSKLGFLGDIIVVNGKVWPNLNVERRQYRFFLLNGSDFRFYNIKLSDGLSFTLIGGDKGLLPNPVKRDEILLAPGERADVLIDFSRLPLGSKIYMTNDARAPYPDGEKPDPETTGQIMRFTIPEYETISVTPVKLPDKLYDQTFEHTDLPKKIHIISDDKRSNKSSLLLDGQECITPVTINPHIDSPEEWVLINLTGGSYPVYFEDVKVKILFRQKFNIGTFINDGKPTDMDSIISYMTGEPIKPEANETGWKDTVRIDRETVTKVLVVPSDGQ